MYYIYRLTLIIPCNMKMHTWLNSYPDWMIGCLCYEPPPLSLQSIWHRISLITKLLLYVLFDWFHSIAYVCKAVAPGLSVCALTSIDLSHNDVGNKGIIAVLEACKVLYIFTDRSKHSIGHNISISHNNRRMSLYSLYVSHIIALEIWVHRKSVKS